LLISPDRCALSSNLSGYARLRSPKFGTIDNETGNRTPAIGWPLHGLPAIRRFSLALFGGAATAGDRGSRVLGMKASLRLMAMRTTILGLIGKRNTMGGDERLLNVEERLKAEYRAVSRKPWKGALGRRER